MAINYPIAENFNPYDSASLIRSKGTSGELVDNPIDYRTPVQGPVQSYSQVPATPTRTSTPTAPAATTPNVASELERIKNEALAVQAKLNAQKNEPTIGQSFQTPGFEQYPSYEELYPTIDEDKIRRNQMKLFQAEINATNKVYDEMLNRERLAGTGRLGTQRAAAARGGLIGSDFGMAQEQNVTAFNQSALNAVQAERSAKIGAIMGTMRQAVVDEIAAKRKARSEDATSYISYLTSARERKAANRSAAATAFLTQDIDPTTLTPDELQAIATEAGLSTGELINEYKIKKSELEASAAESELKTAKTQAEIDKINADIAKGKLVTLGEGTMLYNIETGETYKNPKTYAPGTGSETEVYTDKDLPGAVRTEILDDIQNSQAAKDGTLTPEMLMISYPEVSTETIQSLYDNYYSAPEGPGIGERLSNWWDNFWTD